MSEGGLKQCCSFGFAIAFEYSAEQAVFLTRLPQAWYALVQPSRNSYYSTLVLEHLYILVGFCHTQVSYLRPTRVLEYILPFAMALHID